MENQFENSDVKNFFRNSNVLLTGGTGFIGKLLLSKLLVTCEVSRVYVLIRKKNTKTSQERLQELFDDPVFDYLKDRIPRYSNFIEVIEGDCSLENLGLSRKSEEILCENVNIVIHAAAAMNFLGSLKTAVQTNVCSTIYLLQLVKKIANLKNFTYVSTMATNLDQAVIEEKIYNSHISYDDLLNLLKIDKVLPMDEHDEKKIVGKKLTIYGLTKAASEQIFLKEELPFSVLIFRCAMVLSCWKEPMSGWTDNFYGPNGMIALGLSNGPARFVWEYGSNYSMDATPADYVVNALIAAIPFSYSEYEFAENNEKEVLPCVFNYSNRHKNPLCMDKIVSYMKKKGLRYPVFHSHKITYHLMMLFPYYIPAIFVDAIAPIFGKKFRMLRFFKTINDVTTKTVQMSDYNYRASDINVQKCWKNLNAIDKKLYPFDPCMIKWDEYIPIFIKGVQEFSQRTHKYRNIISLHHFYPLVRYFYMICTLILGINCIQFIYRLYA